MTTTTCSTAFPLSLLASLQSISGISAQISGSEMVKEIAHYNVLWFLWRNHCMVTFLCAVSRLCAPDHNSGKAQG